MSSQIIKNSPNCNSNQKGAFLNAPGDASPSFSINSVEENSKNLKSVLSLKNEIASGKAKTISSPALKRENSSSPAECNANESQLTSKSKIPRAGRDPSPHRESKFLRISKRDKLTSNSGLTSKVNESRGSDSSQRNNSRAENINHQRAKQYEELRKDFRRTKEFPKIEVPAYFEEINRQIDQDLLPPTTEQLQLVQLLELNGLEKLSYYNQKGFLGKLKKQILLVMKTISLICYKIIKTKTFEGISLLIILANCVLLATSSPLVPETNWQTLLDDIFLGLYTTEMALKIFGLGFVMNRNAYLRDYWNILDFTIIITGYLPLFFNSSVNLKALRTLRVLRPLRTISSVKSLRTLVVTLLKASPLIFNALFIIFMTLFIFAIAGNQMFSGLSKRRCFDPTTGRIHIDDAGNTIVCGSITCPSGYVCGKQTFNPDNNFSNFDTVGAALVLAFQVATLQGWSAVCYEIQDDFSPAAVIYFLLLDWSIYYFLVNILVGIMFATFSQQSNGKIARQELTDDQKLAKLVEASKVNILRLQKRNKMQGKASEFYELKADGTLKEISKKNALIMRKSTMGNNSKSFISRISRIVSKQETNRPSRSNSLKKMVSATFFPENLRTSTQEERGDSENQHAPQNFQKAQPKARELEKQVSLTPMPTERQGMLKQAETRKNSQGSSTLEGNPGAQDLNNVVPLEEIIDEIKENSNENSIMKPATKDLEEKIDENVVSNSSPLRPLLPRPLHIKNGTKNSIFPIVGIAGINKADSQQKQKMQALEMQDLFPASSSLYVTPSKLFGKGSSFQRPRPQVLDYKKTGVRKQKKIPTNVSKVASRTSLQRDAENSFQFSLSDTFEGDIKSPKNRRSLKKDGTVISDRARRSLGSRISGIHDTKNRGSKNSLGEIDNEHRLNYMEAINLPEQVLRNMTNFASIALQERREVKDDEENIIENEDEGKFVIDIRELKIVPVYSKDYKSGSYEAVLPKVFQRNQDRIVQERFGKIQKSRLAMQFPLLQPPKKKSGTNSNQDTQESKGITSSVSIPIRKRARTQSFKSSNTIADVERGPMKTSTQLEKSLSRKATKRSESINASGQGPVPQEDGKKNQPGHNKTTKKNLGALQLGLTKGILLEDIALTYQNVREIMTEEIEVDNKDSNEPNDHHHHDDDIENIKGKYFEIREKDLADRKIIRRNFSVPEILKYNFLPNELNTIRLGLAPPKREYDIWHPGISGLIRHFRNIVKDFTNMGIFVNFVLLVVILNTLVLALDDSFSSATATNLFTQANLVFTIIFTVEMGFKIIGLGIVGYVKDLMNIFDGVIVITSLVDVIFSGGSNSATTAFRSARILRTFRVLRVTRLLRSLAFMKILVRMIARSMKSFASVAFLIAIMIFIYALLGMQLMGGQLSNYQNETLYDDLFDALLTTFQIMTTENWNNVIQSVFASAYNSWIGSIYIISWFIIGYWILLNLLVAIILEEFSNDDAKQDQLELEQELHDFNEEEDNRLYSQYMTISGGGSTLNASKGFKKSSASIRQSSLNHKGTITSGLDTALNSENHLTDDDFDSTDKEKPKSRKKKSLFEGIECEDSLFLFPKANWFRKFCYRVMTYDHFDNIVLFVIFFSSLSLAIETYFASSDTSAQNVFQNMDYAINSFFTLEMAIKVISMGFILNKGSYLRDEWNILDCFIVVTSLIDMGLTSVNLPFIKILRMLRTLRPLRFVSHNESMRLVVNSLIKAVPALFNVLIVLFMIMLMFAIFAMSLLKGKLGYCNVPAYMNGPYPDMGAYYGYNLAQCQQSGYSWFIEIVNFENVGAGLLANFILATGDGYPDYMALMMDAADTTTGPIYRGYEWICLYYIVYILMVTEFGMHLFAGVLYMKFEENQEEAKKKGRGAALTAAQQKWVDMQRLIISKKPIVYIAPPKNRIRQFAYYIVRDWGDGTYFDFLVIVVVLANIGSMAANYEGASAQLLNNLTIANYFFTGAFTIEAVVKILAIGFRNYWRDGWSKFDIFVIASSFIDIILTLVGNNISFLETAPQVIRVIRVLRVFRLVKLVKKLKVVQKILWVLWLSVPAVLNMVALFVLVYFMFSVLAVFLFQDIVQGIEYDNVRVSFNSFGIAMLTLFRCSTGEDWYKIMYDTYAPALCSDGSTTSCAQQFAPIFWVAFQLIAQYSMVNMLMSVMVGQFENYFFDGDELSLDSFKENVRNFDAVWVKLSRKYNGLKIKSTSLIKLFASLKKPLGFLDAEMDINEKQKEIAKQIMKMHLRCDQESCVYFNDVLFATLKRAYNKHISEQADVAMLEFIRNEEMKTLRIITRVNKRHLTKAETLKTETIKTSFNPLLSLLYFRMGLAAWKNYAKMIKEKEKECKEKGVAFIQSDDSVTDCEEGEEKSDYNSESGDYSENGNIEEVSERESSSSSMSRSRSSSRRSNNSSKILKLHKSGENSLIIGEGFNAELLVDANKCSVGNPSDEIQIENRACQQEDNYFQKIH